MPLYVSNCYMSRYAAIIDAIGMCLTVICHVMPPCYMSCYAAIIDAIGVCLTVICHVMPPL